MDKILSPFRQNGLLNTLFVSNVFISFHYALIIYVNSSFLSSFFSETQVSALYIIGSILDTLLLLNASKILEKLGNYKFITYCIILETLATLGMAFSLVPFLSGLFFIVHLLTISMLLFNMDVLIEAVSTNEAMTGEIRATYLTLTSVTIVVAPTIVAYLLRGNMYIYVYGLSALALFPLWNIMKRFKKLENPRVAHIQIRETVLAYLKDSNLYNIFISQFLLQFFYAYMVVYVPIYLTKYVGFSWSEIGIMFTIMLLPFILFELPIGELTDGKYEEREFLTIGFIIMGLSTLFISFITVKVFWIWTAVLFLTRVGASFVEISNESFFFKQVDKEKTDIISFFRMTRPISFILAPLLATLTLQFIPFQYIFIVIGTIMVVGAHYSLGLSRTK